MAKTIVQISNQPKVYRLQKTPAELHKQVTLVFASPLLAEETIATVDVDDAGTGIVTASAAVGQAVELDLLGGNGGEQILLTVTAHGSMGSIRQAILLLSVLDPVTMLASEPITPIQRAITYRGNWGEAEAYLRGDVVRSGPDSWLALRPNVGIAPVEGADWTCLTSVSEAEDARQAEFLAAEVNRNAAQAVREAALQAKADQVMGVNPDGTYYTKTAIDNSLNLMTRAEFEALATKRRNIYAGSGFVEWGKHNGSLTLKVNEGITCAGTEANTFYMSPQSTSNMAGISKTDTPRISVNGHLLRLDAHQGSNTNKVVFPPAPATSALLDRQDLVFLEVWHEDVSEKDFVYPFGNVQFGATSYTKPDATTIATVNGAFAGFGTYSLFGNWQASSALIGKGMVWSTMTAANKQAFVSDPENNMYLDGTKIIQVRYRIRVVEGLGSAWESGTGGLDTQKYRYLAYQNTSYIRPKGKKVSIAADLDVVSASQGLFESPNVSVNAANIGKESGVYGINTGTTAGSLGHLDRCFALPIALVHRRNQGAYHPVWNPNGTARFWANDGTTNPKPWYDSLAKQPQSAADCFSFSPTTNGTSGNTAPFVYGNSGAISQNLSWQIARPDGLFYDEINERDVKDLRNSAWKVTDQKRCLEREFNKLVAGTTRGWGKSGFLSQNLVPTGNFSTDLTGWTTAYATMQIVGGQLQVTSDGSVSNHTASCPDLTTTIGRRYLVRFDIVQVVSNTGMTLTMAKVVSTGLTYAYPNSVGTHVFIIETTGTSLRINLHATTAASGTAIFDNLQVHELASMPFSSKTLLACDIIGDPANYPASWKTNGVAGTPLLVAEDGVTSLIPNGTSKTFKMSRKVKTFLLQLASIDNGATWTSSTTFFKSDIEGSGNGFTQSPTASQLYMIFYLTEASPFELATNAEVLSLGSVCAANNNLANMGANLNSWLMGKVPISTTGPLNLRGFDATSFSQDTTGKLVTAAANAPAHAAVTGLTGASGAPAVKKLPYLTRANGKAYLQLLYKEMRHNGTSWGDDGKFNVVDSESTATDLNAATVKIGQKRLELPFFIADGD